jgi:hypothetical protein
MNKKERRKLKRQYKDIAIITFDESKNPIYEYVDGRNDDKKPTKKKDKNDKAQTNKIKKKSRVL